jgi:hypothetical protein
MLVKSFIARLKRMIHAHKCRSNRTLALDGVNANRNGSDRHAFDSDL